MDIFSCSRCSMTFKTMVLLDKHQERFCVKGVLGKSRESDTPEHMLQKVKYFEKRHQDQREKWQEGKLLLGVENQKTNTRFSRKTRKTNSEPTCSKLKHLWIQEQGTLRHPAKYDGEHVTDFANENRKLQREIDLRLQKLVVQTKTVSQVEKMLLQMKAQEQRNTHLMESLIEQLQQVQIDSLRGKAHCSHCDSCPHSTKDKWKEIRHFHTYIPIYGGGALRSEISALRLAYLQNGGNNQLILAQLQDMLNSALQEEMHRRPPLPQRHSTKRKEMEKQLLQEVQNVIRKRRDLRIFKTAYTCPSIQQQLKTMKTEIDLLHQEIKINRLKQMKIVPPTPPLEEMSAKTTTFSKNVLRLSDGLGPAPYDPVMGFVVFYDFLLGLCPMYKACRLVVSLYNGDEEMSVPSPLPLACCEPASLSTYVLQHRRGNVAVLATKQAVPRVCPSPGVSMVLELQASGGYNPHGQEVTHLVSRGWLKMDIFDNYNRVISGRWKVPIRILPIRPSVTSHEINAIPQVDSAELYLRVVNARDAKVQSSSHIDHSNAHLYNYPPLVSGKHVVPGGGFLSHSIHSQVPNALSNLAWTENVDPPPISGLFEHL